jgi:hypothetical protein
MVSFTTRVVAQAPRPSWQGKVLDPANAPIVGARVSAVVSGAALGTSAVTGSNGEFSLDLQSNSYSIKITADGFEDVTQIVDLRDTAAIAAPREFVLKLAPSRFAVTVMEGPGYVTAETLPPPGLSRRCATCRSRSLLSRKNKSATR